MTDFIPLDQVDAKFIPIEDADPTLASKAEQLTKKVVTAPPKLALGAVEAGVGGALDLVNMAVSGAASLGKAAVAKAAGQSFLQTFNEEFDRSYTGIQKAVPYMPETPAGKAILDGISTVMGNAIHGLGEVYYHMPEAIGMKPSPVLGAGAEALLGLAGLAAGPKAAKGKPIAKDIPVLKDAEKGVYENWNDPNYVRAWAERTYPETLRNLQASAVGQVLAKDYKSVDVYNKVHRTLNQELALKDGGGKSLTEKFSLYFDKLDPKKEIPQVDRMRLIDGTLGKLDQLNRLANQDKTPQQLVEGRIIRPKQTLKEIIERQVQLPEGPEVSKGRAKDFKAALAEKHGYVIDPVTQQERPLTAGEYLDLQQRAREFKKPTAEQIVEGKIIKPTQDLVAIIDELTGVKAASGKAGKDMAAALKEPSGIYISDPRNGQVEHQLSIGEYYDMVQQGRAMSPFKQPQGRPSGMRDVRSELDMIPFDQATPLKSDRKLGKPGGRESGVFLTEDEAIAANAESIRKLAEQAPTITAAGMLTEKRYKEINDAMELGQLHDPNRPLSIPKHVAEGIQRRAFDTSGPAKAKLENVGELGEAAKRRFNLIKGAPGAAQLTYNKYSEAIYTELSHREVLALDKLVRARRVIAIDQYKGPGTVQHLAKANGAEMEAFKGNLKNELGADSFNKINAAADKYFRAYQDQLRTLHDNGLVSDEGFMKMLNLEYTPTEALKFIDPERQFTFHGKTVTVRDSGIAELGRGQADPVKMNSKDLLAEHILRVQSRVMKNEANVALLKLAIDLPDNGMVRAAPVKEWTERGEAKGVPDAPAGFQRVDAVAEGKQQPMWLRDDIAEEWVTRPTVMTKEYADFLSVVSGTAVVKTLATTVNPAFAMVNIPRDLMHMWVSSREYNTAAPLAAMQMGVDLVTVAPDAILRRGRWEQFAREGGSQEYLSQQGPANFMGSEVHKMTSSWRPVYNALSYVGATSEAWTRLALRERAIKNGKESWEASAVAREYLDFSDGGSWVKGLDTVIPYMNAATQAMYTTGKQAKRDPLRVAFQATQVLGVSTGVALAASQINPEAWRQIPQEQKLKNFVIAPKDMFVIDPQGNKRHVYFTLAIDGNWVPLNALGIALVDRAATGKVPDGITMDALQSLNPLLQGLPIPTISAGASYAANYNFWLDDAIWKGGKILPEDEIIPADKPGATPELWKQLGEITGASPVRMQAAAGALAPRNPYTDLMGGSYQYWMAGASDADKAKMTMQLIAENPILRRVVKLTHPFTAEVEALDRAERERGSEKYKQASTIGEIIFRDANKQGDAKAEFRTWIETQPPEERDRLTKQFVSKYSVDKVFRQLKASDGIPSQNWWRATSMADPTVRADVFYQEWVTRDQAGREQMVRVANALGRVGLSYQSEEFNRQFGMQIKQWGAEQR
jgi:hypothetical protein